MNALSAYVATVSVVIALTLDRPFAWTSTGLAIIGGVLVASTRGRLQARAAPLAFVLALVAIVAWSAEIARLP